MVNDYVAKNEARLPIHSCLKDSTVRRYRIMPTRTHMYGPLHRKLTPSNMNLYKVKLHGLNQNKTEVISTNDDEVLGKLGNRTICKMTGPRQGDKERVFVETF